MLTKFSVTNFKGFEKELVFDLTKTGNYAFNTKAVKNGVVNCGMIYGFNGCGKSNLGHAIFDIFFHLTDRKYDLSNYEPYLNLNAAKERPALFQYEFVFHNTSVLYRYEKRGIDKLLKEELIIDDRIVLHYDFSANTGEVLLEGAESLKVVDSESAISRVKYVNSNAILALADINIVFLAFVQFVEKMVYFYSFDQTAHIGFRSGSEKIAKFIMEAGKTKAFESFLKKNNVDIDLVEEEVEGELRLMAHYKRANVSFSRVASRGSMALMLFYHWYIVLEKASFVYMDEFDAFYHFELAENIVNMIKQIKGPQVIFTTHNTDLLSNDILRPDCYFLMDDSKITSFSALTEKELRKAHNLQKMFKAGAFHG